VRALTHSPSSWILAPNSYRYSNTSKNLAKWCVEKNWSLPLKDLKVAITRRFGKRLTVNREE
jgi:hypothetical protein